MSNGTDLASLGAYVALIGSSVSQSLTPVVTESIAFGVYTALVASTVFVIVRSRSRVRMKRLVLLAVCVAMYAFAAAHLGLALADLFVEDRKSGEIQQMVLTCIANVNTTGAGEANECQTMPAGVLAAKGSSTWVSVTLLTLTVTCSLWNIVVDYDHHGISDSSFATLVSWLIQAWSTGLIAYRAWQQRQHVKIELLTSFRTRAERVLLLFMESGIVYCLFLTLLAASNIADFIAASVPQLGSSDQRTLSGGIKALEAGALIDIVGSYPTALILLVELSNSYAQRTLSVGDTLTLPPAHLPRAVEMRVLGGVRDGGALPGHGTAGETVRLCLHAAAGSDASVVEPMQKGDQSEAGKGVTQSSPEYLTG
ncbi:hypothetical protein PsYK624_032960 [Phanerochaete sordida]|uniref:Uncharacterized protein n=1 Tax=Phanerochaete sordida TaxID=48140 RepID=A0A9P3G1D3_9APHY|nr:hypothetical protein PsYK624_032960 [Phanerochaete sordida]